MRLMQKFVLLADVALTCTLKKIANFEMKWYSSKL